MLNEESRINTRMAQEKAIGSLLGMAEKMVLEDGWGYGENQMKKR